MDDIAPDAQILGYSIGLNWSCTTTEQYRNHQDRFGSMRRKSILIIAFLSILVILTGITSQPCYAQKSQALRLYQDAQNYVGRGEFDQAKSALSRVISIDSNYAEAHLVLGDIYKRAHDYNSAIRHYQKVVDLKPSLSVFLFLNLGESLLRTAQYQKALNALRHYESLFPDQPDRTRNSGKFIEDCLFSLAYFSRQSHSGQDEMRKFNPTHLETAINSEEDEYFPKLTADLNTMIFTRKVNGIENFFQTEKNKQGEWSMAAPLKGAINSQQFNEGAHCISPDGKSLYFTGCNRPGGMGSCDIYVSKRIGDQWGPPRNLGAPINTSGWEAQPALSADGQVLYFVSNRTGGQGGYDIWKSELQDNGSWGIPVNLGPQINTTFDESAPFIHADNQTLYFSSNGWPGFGDRDIFVSKMDKNGHWKTPENLGYPINDHEEQRALTISMNGKLGYFSNFSPDGSKNLDIYSVEIPEHQRPVHVSYIRGQVEDAIDNQPLKGVEILITDLSSENITFKGISSPEEGTFLVPLIFGNHYALHVRHPGYLFHSSHYTLTDSTNKQDGYDLRIALQPIAKGHEETLQNVFFDIGKYELLEASRTELTHLKEFLITNPAMHIEIGGHTDNTGTEKSNQLLSEQRAQAIMDYLIKAGIKADRLSYKGYGQHKPVASNQHEDTRKLNRRTDFRIISNE